jgi:3'-phosphoadenosine 5'-phosphosulfate sulfotransferase (PAPS reductase)/FAD synthetase
MTDPFKIYGPTCLSFSGGRTSAYMLWRVLQANTPEDIARWLVVCFANTGKETEATLVFVRECAQRWGITVVWVEYRAEEPGYAVVDFETASRNGEPFEAIIRKRNYLPNPITRFCTVELKIRAMHKYLRSLGWGAGDHEWDQMVGIRADEPRRVAKIRARPSPETTKATMVMPLANAGISVGDVGAFWSKQPFNLMLTTTPEGRTLDGNCDLCFLKPRKQIVSLISRNPSTGVWWARMESLGLSSKPDGASFRNDRPSYATMVKNAEEQVDAFGFLPDDEPGMACFCGD